LAKVTKTVSSEMLLCRASLAHKSGKTARAATFLPGYLVALLPCMQKVAMPYAISPAGCFSGFFPKLFC